MAVTKIWPIKGRLRNVIDYTVNPEKTLNPDYTFEELQALKDVIDYAMESDKTEKQFYVTGVNCTAGFAREQMVNTKRLFKKEDGILAFHGYQSFKPGEVTVEGREVGFSFDPTTHTVRIELETPVTQKATVCVSGADLRNRNLDVTDQAVEILKRSQTGMEFKKAVYEKMLSCNPITEYELYITSRSPEERATVAAVLELYLSERESLR